MLVARAWRATDRLDAVAASSELGTIAAQASCSLQASWTPSQPASALDTVAAQSNENLTARRMVRSDSNCHFTAYHTWGGRVTLRTNLWISSINLHKSQFHSSCSIQWSCPHV